MESKKSIKLNYIYNVAYQILLLVTPLVTTPYVSRVIGAEGIGIYSFAESIVSYFVLFAAIGISTYGQREISYVQEDKEKRSSVFWNTKFLSLITTMIALCIYAVFAWNQQNKVVYLVLAFNIIAIAADVTWFFQGVEEFGKIVVRNAIFKIINIAYIFSFIKRPEDLTKYIFGVTFLLFASNLSLWLYLPKFVQKPNWKQLRPFKNMKVVISLFIPTIAIQIYTVLDKTMIGLFTVDSVENGFYEQALKMSKMVLTLVTSLGTVMIPRIGYHFERKEHEMVKQYMYRGYNFIWFLGVPLCFGLIGVSHNFVPWFYGEGYDKVAPLLSVLGLLIISIGINNVTGMQYLIPTRRQNIFTITVIIGATVNLIMNLILIPKFYSIGAAIASVSAESTIAVVQLIAVRKELSIKKIVGMSWHYLLAGGGMLGVLLIENSRFDASFLNTMFMVSTGAVVYFLMLVLLRDKFLLSNIKNVISQIMKRKKGKVC